MVKESHMHFVLKGNNNPQEDTNEMQAGRGDTRLEDFWDGKQLQWTVNTSWVERRLVKGWCAWFSDDTGFVIYYFRHWQAASKITPFDSYLLVFIPSKKPLLFSWPEFINSLLLNRLTSFRVAQGCRFQDRVAKSLASILGTLPFTLREASCCVKRHWEGNSQEGQRSPNGGNSLQGSDIFISLKPQEETN